MKMACSLRHPINIQSRISSYIICMISMQDAVGIVQSSLCNARFLPLMVGVSIGNGLVYIYPRLDKAHPAEPEDYSALAHPFSP